MAQIEITRQSLRLIRQVVMIEYHGNARIRAQSLATGTGGQIHTTQIDRHGADRADGIDAQFDIKFRTERGQTLDIVKHPAGGLAMRTPEPAWHELAFQHLPRRRKVQRLAPGKLKGVKIQTKASGMVHQALAEFTVAQDQACSLFQRKLAGDHIVGQRAGPKEQLHSRGLDQLTQNLLGRLEILGENLGPMRFGGLLEGAADLAADRYWSRQEIDRARLKSA